MRLWHKDLIPVLPNKQLRGQWRECCLIAKNIAEKGTPNHLLVNRIMEFPLEDFLRYTELVQIEMKKRGYNAELSKFYKYFDIACRTLPCDPLNIVEYLKLFYGWHDYRYLTQCYYNLEEKYDCGGITKEEWSKIHNYYIRRIKNV